MQATNLIPDFTEQRAYHIEHTEPLNELALLVLEAMRLIDDENAPVYAGEQLHVGDDDLVRRDQALELVALWDDVACLVFVEHLVILEHDAGGVAVNETNISIRRMNLTMIVCDVNSK